MAFAPDGGPRVPQRDRRVRDADPRVPGRRRRIVRREQPTGRLPVRPARRGAQRRRSALRPPMAISTSSTATVAATAPTRSSARPGTPTSTAARSRSTVHSARSSGSTRHRRPGPSSRSPTTTRSSTTTGPWARSGRSVSAIRGATRSTRPRVISGWPTWATSSGRRSPALVPVPTAPGPVVRSASVGVRGRASCAPTKTSRLTATSTRSTCIRTPRVTARSWAGRSIAVRRSPSSTGTTCSATSARGALWAMELADGRPTGAIMRVATLPYLVDIAAGPDGTVYLTSIVDGVHALESADG